MNKNYDDIQVGDIVLCGHDVEWGNPYIDNVELKQYLMVAIDSYETLYGSDGIFVEWEAVGFGEYAFTGISIDQDNFIAIYDIDDLYKI